MAPPVESGIRTITAPGTGSGLTFVPADSPLTMLNYFDGKFLRASELKVEQDYLRRLVWLSNQGGGSGIIYGYDATLDGGKLAIGEGLAIDAQGRVLLLPAAQSLDIERLLEASRRTFAAPALRPPLAFRRADRLETGFTDCVDETAADPGVTAGGAQLWIICIAHAQRLCGTEDVYGRLCEEACTTGTDRPYAVEGIVVHARQLTLRRGILFPKTLSLTSRHLRSQVAAAFFAGERDELGSLISAHGLSQETWCLGADYLAQGCVPVALIARSGERTLFLDAWTVRRERIEPPPRRYWAWRMAMRPWDVYLAHILQFQCQLHEVLGEAPEVLNLPTPCAGQREVLDETLRYVRDLEDSYEKHVTALAARAPRAAAVDDVATFRLSGGLSALSAIGGRLADALKRVTGGTGQRVLITGGIVELPSAGYLPVDPASRDTVNAQVRRLVGEGLDLRFCVVRPDFVPHALEEAQHMDRISLLEGLDNPEAKPEVDVLVPFGELIRREAPVLDGYDTTIQVNSLSKTLTRVDEADPVLLHGAGRAEELPGGGAAFHLAVAQEVAKPGALNSMVEALDAFRGLSGTELKKRAGELAGEPVRAINADVLRTLRPHANLISRLHVRAAAASVLAPAPAAAAAAGPEPAVLWATMRGERNPFDLRLAESTLVSFEARFMLQKKKPSLVHSQLMGTLTVTQATRTTPTGRQMSGQIRGSHLLETLVDGAAASPATRSDLILDAELLQTGDAGAGSLIVKLGMDPLFYQITTTWSGAPRTADVKVAIGRYKPADGFHGAARGGPALAVLMPATASYDWLAAHLTSSPDVLVLGNPIRGLATSAIELIAQHLAAGGQINFADAALLSLFPPPPPPVEDLSVRATLDWVLFHRRRTKSCSIPTERPAPPAVRRYAVYHFLATKDPRKLRDKIAKALNTPNEIAGLEGYQRVDDVEYSGGLPTLLTRTDAVLSDWSGAEPTPGNTLVYAAIATSAAGDPPALEGARLARLLDVLSPVTRADPTHALDPVTEVLPRVPDALAVPGADGIVFIVSTPVVQTVCHEVYHAVLSPLVLRLLDGATIAEILANSRGQINKVGVLTFPAGTAVPEPASAAKLKSKWPGGTPSVAVVYPHVGDPAAGDQDVREAQARAAAELVGTTGVQVSHRNTTGDWPSASCPVITVLAVLPRAARVIVTEPHGFTPAGAPIPGTTQPLGANRVHFDGVALGRDAALDKTVTDLDAHIASVGAALGTVYIGRIEMALGGPADAGDQKRLKAVVEEFKTKLPALTRDVNAVVDPARDFVHAADAEEAPFLTAGAVRFTDVLHVFLKRG